MDGQLPDSVRQTVTAEAGYAYGVIGADLHVFPGRGPVYLLSNYEPANRTSGRPARPSYLLNARSAVVDFVGRDDEVRDLTAWRDGDGRSVRWLHAPGGQGKTRLAGQLADLSVHSGWKVVVADHAAGRVDARNATSQDLRIGSARGLLLVVDYADRWPLSHLTWLFSNTLLTKDVPVRVLLLARTAHVWPALCHALVQAGWPPDACATQCLGPLPGDEDSRTRMFTMARDGFARRYALTDPRLIPVPNGLERDEFGLTLAVHMAALVAVDRHVHAQAQPLLEDMRDLTAYLLDRERHHWHTLYDTGAARDPAGGRATFTTTPEQMARAVFTAALTGPLGYRDAKAALETVGADADHVLADHTFCYPPADPRTVLQPLYPDRLAEDFLALCLPGHDIPGPWTAAWADGVPELLLGPLPSYASRTIAFLTAASDRWPHLLPILAAVEPLVPSQTHGALTIAAADLAERLATHRLATTTDPAERARIHLRLGERLEAADRRQMAAAAAAEAARLYRPLAEADPSAFELDLADALLKFATRTLNSGSAKHWTTVAISGGAEQQPPGQHDDEAVAALGEAVEIYRRLDLAGDKGSADLASINMTLALFMMEKWEEAWDSLSVVLSRPDLMAQSIGILAAGLNLHVSLLEKLDRPDDARSAAGDAVALWRRIVARNPRRVEMELQSALRTYGRVLYNSERYDEGLRAMREAVDITRRLVQANPSEHAALYRFRMEELTQILVDQERWDEALPAAVETVQVSRRLAAGDPDRHEENLACDLSVLAWILRSLDRSAEEAVALDEATAVRRRLARDDPAKHRGVLSTDLWRLALALADTARWHDALTAAAEAIETNPQADQLATRSRETYVTCGARMLTNWLADPDWGMAEVGDLTGLAKNFTALLSTHGRAAPGLAEAVEEARRQFVERNPAGQLYRRLTGTDILADPATNPDEVAAALTSRAMTLRSLGRHEEALAPAWEVTEIYDRLASTDPLAHAPAQIEAWMRVAVVLEELGTAPDRAMEIAIRKRRILARHDPTTHEPALAAELAIMARTLAKQGRWTEAVAHGAESFAIRRGLGETGIDDLTATDEFLTTHLTPAELQPAALRAAVNARRSGQAAGW